MRKAAGLAVGLMLLAGAAQAQEAAGEWHGVLKAGPSDLRIGLSVRPGPDGGLVGFLTSPDQTPAPIPLEKVSVTAGTLSFASAMLHAGFEGKWDAERKAWVGVFTQGSALPFVLEKGPVPARLRPQTPRPPYPYREEPVAFESAPGVKLAGTLTLPQGAGPFPAVVMITGSGPQDRDETLFEHKPFAVIADALTRRGVAVLRYDDRGVGQSTGGMAGATSEDFAGDVAAGVAALRARPDIDGRRIGLIGHSEGGLIAPIAAAADPHIAFIVLMAGPGVPGSQLMAAQRQATAKVLGAPPESIAAHEALMARFDAAMAGGPDLASARADAARIIAEAPSLPARAQMQGFSTAWYRWFLRYDPAPTLKKLKIPVLALNGGNDLQVVPALNLGGLQAALKGDSHAEFVELPGLNHLFQTSANGDPRAYGLIEETIAPAALDRMVEWVVIQAKAEKGSLR